MIYIRQKKSLKQKVYVCFFPLLNEFLAPCQNVEKTNDTIPGKCLDRQDGLKDRRTDRPYFKRSFLATAGGSKCAPETTSRPLPNLVNNPKQPIQKRIFFFFGCKGIIKNLHIFKYLYIELVLFIWVLL